MPSVLFSKSAKEELMESERRRLSDLAQSEVEREALESQASRAYQEVNEFKAKLMLCEKAVEEAGTSTPHIVDLRVLFANIVSRRNFAICGNNQYASYYDLYRGR